MTATTDYQLVYLQYERLHRHHPHWPLGDLKEMTPRQRKHWILMGDKRREQKQAEIDRAVEKGMVPVG